ncbi:hypothetical protein D3C84_929930 [compost metagenome]
MRTHARLQVGRGETADQPALAAIDRIAEIAARRRCRADAKDAHLALTEIDAGLLAKGVAVVRHRQVAIVATTWCYHGTGQCDTAQTEVRRARVVRQRRRRACLAVGLPGHRADTQGEGVAGSTQHAATGDIRRGAGGVGGEMETVGAADERVGTGHRQPAIAVGRAAEVACV